MLRRHEVRKFEADSCLYFIIRQSSYPQSLRPLFSKNLDLHISHQMPSSKFFFYITSLTFPSHIQNLVTSFTGLWHQHFKVLDTLPNLSKPSLVCLRCSHRNLYFYVMTLNCVTCSVSAQVRLRHHILSTVPGT